MKLNDWKLLLIVAAIAFSTGKFLSPKEIEIKEVEKIVYKEHEIKEEEKKTRSVRRQTVLPDGTKVTEVTRETERETKSDFSKEGESTRSYEKQVKTQSNGSIGYYTNTKEQIITADVRILGGVFAGIYGKTEMDFKNQSFGLGIRLEF